MCIAPPPQSFSVHYYVVAVVQKWLCKETHTRIHDTDYGRLLLFDSLKLLEIRLEKLDEFA